MTVQELKAEVAAASARAKARFLADTGVTPLPGETTDQAVRRVQMAVCDSIRALAAIVKAEGR